MRLAEINRRYGFQAASHALTYRLVRRFLVLDVTYLMVIETSAIPASTGDELATFRTIGYDEAVAFSEDPSIGFVRSMAPRLQGRWDHCFGALIDGKLVGYYWLAQDSVEAEHNRGGEVASGVALSYPADSIFSYKAFVHSDYRGQGLYTQLVHAAARWARDNLGVRHLYSTADWTNFAALRSCERQGMKPMGRVWRFGVEPYMFTIGPRAAAAYGIRLCGHANVTDRALPAASRCNR